MMAQTGYQVLQSNISYGKKQEERAARGIQELWKDWEKAKLKPNTHIKKKKAQWISIGSTVLEVQRALSALRCAGRVQQHYHHV